MLKSELKQLILECKRELQEEDASKKFGLSQNTTVKKDKSNFIIEQTRAGEGSDETNIIVLSNKMIKSLNTFVSKN
jgi:hypothetical protein